MLYETMCDTLHPPSKMASIIVSRNVIKLQKKKEEKESAEIIIPSLPEGGGGYTVLPLSVQDIFRRIFLSNC